MAGILRSKVIGQVSSRSAGLHDEERSNLWFGLTFSTTQHNGLRFSPHLAIAVAFPFFMMMMIMFS